MFDVDGDTVNTDVTIEKEIIQKPDSFKVQLNTFLFQKPESFKEDFKSNKSVNEFKQRVSQRFIKGTIPDRFTINTI